MIYITGDIHGRVEPVVDFIIKHQIGSTDLMILLGDVGLNYYGGIRDIVAKSAANSCGVPMLCIHGNHEMRPATIPTYQTKKWNGGDVWYEEKFPNLLFAKDGEIYTIDGKRFLVIGGAFSVDKDYRLANHFGWWADEQPDEETKKRVERVIKTQPVDYILSHTCPFRYIPREMFLPFVDQSRVDDSTERWLDRVEHTVSYKGWYCGHWHTDKRIDKMHFLFQTVERIE